MEFTARGWIDGMPLSSTQPPERSRSRTICPAVQIYVFRQQAAEEQVPVCSQSAPQSLWIGHQMERLGQFLHTHTISAAGPALRTIHGELSGRIQA